MCKTRWAKLLSALLAAYKLDRVDDFRALLNPLNPLLAARAVLVLVRLHDCDESWILTPFLPKPEDVPDEPAKPARTAPKGGG